MPIIIKPTKAGMQDIDRSTFKQSGYDVDKKLPKPKPNVSAPPAPKPDPKPKPMSKEGSMDNMREYMDIFDGIEEEGTLTNEKLKMNKYGDMEGMPEPDDKMTDLNNSMMQIKLVDALAKAANVNRQSVYFDDADLVWGSKTVINSVLADEEYTFQRAVDELKKFADANPKAESVDEQDIEMEEDCGCDEEAVDAMISVPVQELQDILQLAGYENYADKIQEYANEPEEEYGSVEDQMIGLSGGLNGPKKMYPASADGDNPMNQEPREIEENTMEAVEEKLYKSYKDFLEEAEIEVDEEITKGTGKKGLEKSLDKLYGPKKGSTKKVDKD